VFTVEPGIYFIDALLEKLRASEHAGLVDWTLVGELGTMGGVRIEDDIVVTGSAIEGAAAARNLTREVLPVGGGVA
jgi:Xaa-Pro dipeptidase